MSKKTWIIKLVSADGLTKRMRMDYIPHTIHMPIEYQACAHTWHEALLLEDYPTIPSREYRIEGRKGRVCIYRERYDAKR